MKKKFKFNTIDVIVVVLIVGVAAFLGVKLLGGGFLSVIESENNAKKYEYEFTFHSYEMPDYVKEYIKTGSSVRDDGNLSVFGKVVSYSFGESQMFNPNSEGVMVTSPKEGHSSMDLVVRGGVGEQGKHGVVIEEGVYGVGHTITIRVGNAKVYCKISGIKKLKKIEE